MTAPVTAGGRGGRISRAFCRGTGGWLCVCDVKTSGGVWMQKIMVLREETRF